MEDAAERGSARMFRRRFESGISEDLAGLEKLLDAEGLDILDVWIKGQPPRIDEFTGTVRVGRENLGLTIERLLALENINVDVLIRGQPPRFDAVDIEFRTPGLR